MLEASASIEISNVAPDEKTSKWTDERVQMLKRLWAAGLSAGAICKQLGGDITRNAVIGKAHRLNLAGRPNVMRAPPVKRSPTRTPSLASNEIKPNAKEAFVKPVKAEPSPNPAPLPEPKPLTLVDLPKGGRVTILHLTDKTCKWPIGDPGHDDFCFCGHKPRDRSPYCEYHARISYQPLQDKRHRYQRRKAA